MTATPSEALLARIPVVATGELVGPYADPNPGTLALASVHIANGLSKEYPFSHDDVSRFLGLSGSMLAGMDERLYAQLSPETRASLQACSQVGAQLGALRAAAGYGPRMHTPGASLANMEENVLGVSLDVSVFRFGGPLAAAVEKASRESLSLFGAALGTLCLDLAEREHPAMHPVNRPRLAGELHAVGARFLIQYSPE